jgi:lysophospholipase L1-like esterase
MSTRVSSVCRWIGPLAAVSLLAACASRVDAPPIAEETDPANQVPTTQPSPTGTAPAPSATTTAPAPSSTAPAPASTSPAPVQPEPVPDPSDEPAPGTDPDFDPEPLPDDGTLRILPLGDSITLGVEGGYRNDLFNVLTTEGHNVDFVGTQWDTSTKIDDKDHEGHPGFTIANVRAGVDGWLETVTTPDVVLLMLGTNDEAWWTTKQPTETKDELMELVAHLFEKLPDAALIVATIPPQSPANVEPIDRDRGEMAAEYNSLLRGAVAGHTAYGSRLFLADVGAALELSDLYDGIHPTREAHVEIADLFHEALVPLL